MQTTDLPLTCVLGNSGPHACMACALPTETCLQFQYDLFFHVSAFHVYISGKMSNQAFYHIFTE